MEVVSVLLSPPHQPNICHISEDKSMEVAIFRHWVLGARQNIVKF
jgi:hypothetical protein